MLLAVAVLISDFEHAVAFSEQQLSRSREPPQQQAEFPLFAARNRYVTGKKAAWNLIRAFNGDSA